MSRSMPTTVLEAAVENPAKLIDHTLLRPQASLQQVEQLCEEAVELVCLGCDEIDMVIQISHALAGDISGVEEEIAQVVLASSAAKVKVIIECYYLSSAQKIALTNAVVNAGAAFVKTSTGFGPSGAIVEDVRLLTEAAGGRVGVKAAGGIRSLAELHLMQKAGASRIGTSTGVEIMQQWCAAQRRQ